MTEPLFHTDSYLRTFDARVVSAEGTQVVLDRTAFYPGGGGQPHDTGTFDTGSGAVRVLDVRRDGALVVHVVERDAELSAGDAVRGTIDWERRYRLMRTHTAMHILCAVMWRDYAALVTGGNMEPGRGRLDFDFAGLDWAVARTVEARINEEVRAARPVHVAFHAREDAARIPHLVRTKTDLVPADVPSVRTVEIVGLDLQADGGTHVANTGEVGPVKIVALKNKGRSNKRVELALAEALEQTTPAARAEA
jgi:misacylated tRNA(Ala) deacylase